MTDVLLAIPRGPLRDFSVALSRRIQHELGSRTFQTTTVAHGEIFSYLISGLESLDIEEMIAVHAPDVRTTVHLASQSGTSVTPHVEVEWVDPKTRPSGCDRTCETSFELASVEKLDFGDSKSGGDGESDSDDNTSCAESRRFDEIEMAMLTKMLKVLQGRHTPSDLKISQIIERGYITTRVFGYQSLPVGRIIDIVRAVPRCSQLFVDFKTRELVVVMPCHGTELHHIWSASSIVFDKTTKSWDVHVPVIKSEMKTALTKRKTPPENSSPTSAHIDKKRKGNYVSP